MAGFRGPTLDALPREDCTRTPSLSLLERDPTP